MTNSSGHDVSPGPILSISGGFASSNHNQTLQAAPLFDRSYITQIQPICAIQVYHKFSRVTASNGNSLASLFRETSVDVRTNLWPQRSFSCDLGKPLILFNRTRPFYCYIQTAFQSDSTTKSPSIALRVERPVNDRALLYYQFGTNPCAAWLGVNPTLGRYFGLPFFNPQPSVDIGYFWNGSRLRLKRHERPDQYKGSDLIVDQENLSRVDDFEGQFGCTVTTLSACLSARYAFHVSSGLPKGDARSTKIEIAAYLQDSLSVTGVVRALRDVGHSTQLGVGIAIKPGIGLFLTCSWSRWGQDLNLPIFVVPHGLLDNTWALVALVVPCTIGALVELAILKPRRRQKCRNHKKKKRELPNSEKDTEGPE